MQVEPPTTDDLLDVLRRYVQAHTVKLPARAAPTGSGIRRPGLAITLVEDRVSYLADALADIAGDPQLSDAQRVARLMIAIADSGTVEPLEADAERAARDVLDDVAVLIVSMLTRSRDQDGAPIDLGILEQGSMQVFRFYLGARQIPTREQSLALACEHTLNRNRRARGVERAAPRDRPQPGGAPVCGIGTPVTRVTDVEQAESLRHAEPVARAVRDATWLPDIPGRDIVPSRLGLAHATEREEESESTLMSYAAFVGVDGDRCALGMGYAISRLEIWGAPTLVFGSYPEAGQLARVYPGSMNGRTTRPMLDDDEHLYQATTEFLKARRPAILTRATKLTAAIGMDPGPREALHAEVLAADPFAFDATALTHRRAMFLTATNLHWAHAQPHELEALAELGLHPVPRWPGDRATSDAVAQVAQRPGVPGHGRPADRSSDTNRRRSFDASSVQTLRGYARIHGLDLVQTLDLLEAAFEPGLTVSRASGTIGSHDWERIAQTKPFDS